MDQVPDVELRLPAETAYVSVLRMTTAGLAARLDFTLDDIEDLRIAVGEACALVLDDAADGGSLHGIFELGEHTMRVCVAADSASQSPLDEDSFGWQVLTALVGDVVADHTGGRRSVAFTVSSQVRA